MLCLDGWCGWVLHAVRIRSENAAELQPDLQATLDDFGPPLAFVRDLGSAMAKAVAAYRTSPTLDLVCQFHFLAAVGSRLLDADHATLRRALTSCEVRSGLRDLLRSTPRPEQHADIHNGRHRQLWQWDGSVPSPRREMSAGCCPAKSDTTTSQAVLRAGGEQRKDDVDTSPCYDSANDDLLHLRMHRCTSDCKAGSKKPRDWKKHDSLLGRLVNLRLECVD